MTDLTKSYIRIKHEFLDTPITHRRGLAACFDSLKDRIQALGGSFEFVGPTDHVVITSSDNMFDRVYSWPRNDAPTAMQMLEELCDCECSYFGEDDEEEDDD